MKCESSRVGNAPPILSDRRKIHAGVGRVVNRWHEENILRLGKKDGGGMRQKVGDYLLDVSKLIFAGVVLRVCHKISASHRGC